MTLCIRSLDELTELGKQVSHVLHAGGTWPAHDVVQLTQVCSDKRAIRMDRSSRFKSRGDGDTYARMCRIANQASLFFSCCVLRVYMVE